MLRLTKKADYGIMAMRYLAEHADEGRAHSARDIAAAYHIPLPALAKTLQVLARVDIAISHAGAGGGYTLARPARDISTFEVISALDGPLDIVGCYRGHAECCMANHCSVKQPLTRINQSIRQMLAEISVADLLERHDSRLDEALISIRL